MGGHEPCKNTKPITTLYSTKFINFDVIGANNNNLVSDGRGQCEVSVIAARALGLSRTGARTLLSTLVAAMQR